MLKIFILNINFSAFAQFIKSSHSINQTKAKFGKGLELVSPNRNYRHTTAPSKMAKPFVLKTRNATETKYNKK